MDEGIKVQRKKMNDQSDFRVAWSPSLLGDQAIERKNTNYFFYK
jgi:hypothetical protein